MVAATCVVLLSLLSTPPDSTGCAARRTTAGGAASAHAPIRLQLVPTIALPDGALETAVDEAARIWAQYGVEVTATRELRRPVDGSAVWITLVVGGARSPASQAAGDVRELACLTFVDGVPGRLMSASWETAEKMVAAAGLDDLPALARDQFTARLLGRAVAHELGHYLLRTRQHASRGLMRATFRRQDVLARRPGAFDLDPAQRLALAAQGR